MPEWNFFAFHAGAVSRLMLEPAQSAVRNGDLQAWQKVYDQLSETRYSPHVSPAGWDYSPNKNNIAFKIQRDKIPEESEFGLRRTLETFVEQVSLHRLKGKFFRPRSWIFGNVVWPNVLKSQAEHDELELFKALIIARSKKLPDPFWCLESNSAVDSNYVDPQAVAKMAEVEADVGLFRGLVRRTDLNVEIFALARDMAAASLLVELAASCGLAIYFREDGT